MVGKAWRQDLEAASHIVAAVKNGSWRSVSFPYLSQPRAPVPGMNGAIYPRAGSSLFS